jgi:signal transduction histidine kinase
MSGTNYSTGGLQRFTRLRRGMLSLLIGGLLAAVVVGAVEFKLWRELSTSQEQLKAPPANKFTSALQVQRGLEQMNAALLRFQLSNDVTEQQTFEAVGRELKGLVTHGGKNLEALFAQYLQDAALLLEQPLAAVRKDSAERVQRQVDKISDPLRRACAAWVAEQEKSFTDLLTTSASSLQTGRRLIEVSGILLVLILATAVILAYAPLRSRVRETEAALDRRERLASLGTLATGIAHEIRNPLAAIKFRLFSLRKALPPPLAGNEDLVVIKHEIDRLEQMVKDFLLFARPAEPKTSAISARQLLQDVHALLQPQLDKRRVRLEAEAAEDILLNADKEQLEQVLINLVQNAADSIDGDGAITLRARQGVSKVNGQSRPLIVLEVSDTGRGIPPEVEARIFDPFFSTKDSGTGLGLPIAARIIEKHGGFIQYQSQVNRGTVFSIMLPRLETHVTAHPAH